MSAWKTIDHATGNDPHDDDFTEVLLTDGELRKIGWVLRRPSGSKQGMVAGHHGHKWTHFTDLPAPPQPGESNARFIAGPKETK